MAVGAAPGGRRQVVQCPRSAVRRCSQCTAASDPRRRIPGSLCQRCKTMSPGSLPFVSKPHRKPVSGKAPDFLEQAALSLARSTCSGKRPDLGQPDRNLGRFRLPLSGVEASATHAGSRLFHASSARRRLLGGGLGGQGGNWRAAHRRGLRAAGPAWRRPRLAQAASASTAGKSTTVCATSLA